jgi:hypothetical protein
VAIMSKASRQSEIAWPLGSPPFRIEFEIVTDCPDADFL